MIYNDFNGTKLSALGLGCMRLPHKEGEYAEIDIVKTREIVDYAISHGINYFDTGWGYHGGNSEPVMGEILSDYSRDNLYLASKFPAFEIGLMDKVREIFPKQLKRCRCDHFDFYLFHNVWEMNIDYILDPKFGVVDYLKEQKKNGVIRHLGFSSHGSPETVKRFVDALDGEVEFCQLQVNWLDWELQNAKLKCEYLNSCNIPIWVMEPVRGGALINLDEKHIDILKSKRPDMKISEWSFKFIQGIDGVAMTLSGMSNMEQLKENIATFEERKPLSDEETSLLYEISAEKRGGNNIPCTSCKYCTSKCPGGLNIPWLIELYNNYMYSGAGPKAPRALGTLPDDKLPSACVACRACEKVCPQGIKISEMMSDFAGRISDNE